MELKDLEKALNEERLESEVSTAQVVAYISNLISNNVINKNLSKGTSYGLKHQVERFYQVLEGDESKYCSNNRVKFALYLLGCRLKREDDGKLIQPFDSKYDIREYDNIVRSAILDNGVNFRYASGRYLTQKEIMKICKELE